MERKITVGISFSPDMIDDIDRLIAIEKSKNPRQRLNRSSFVRLAVVAAIESRRAATCCTTVSAPGPD